VSGGPTLAPPRRRRARKADELRRALAGRLLQAEPGDPLPPIRSLAATFGASIGATQIALAQLADDGIVELDSRPGRGGLLVRRDIGRLYQEAERTPVLVALSLPSTERINGLATAIRASFSASNVETYLTFIRGSRPRMAALEQGRCNVAVMSRLAAEALAPQPAFTIALTLPPGTFVREHRVFLASGDRHPGHRPRVGIDRSSFDFERLTELEFGDTADLVPLNYLKVVREIESDAIDAGILDVDDALMRIPVGMPSRPLSPSVLAALAGANLSTSFVTRSPDIATQAVIRACLDPGAMVRIQEDVIEGRRPPEY
jgi:YhfZ-like protein/regulatory GntR family protein